MYLDTFLSEEKTSHLSKKIVSSPPLVYAIAEIYECCYRCLAMTTTTPTPYNYYYMPPPNLCLPWLRFKGQQNVFLVVYDLKRGDSLAG